MQTILTTVGIATWYLKLFFWRWERNRSEGLIIPATSWQHPWASLVVTVWRVVGRHLSLNVIPNNFMARARWKVWCDRNLRGWSQQPILTPFVGNSGCNNVKRGGPTSISQHNPQQSHGQDWTKSLVWSGRESRSTKSLLVIRMVTYHHHHTPPPRRTVRTKAWWNVASPKVQVHGCCWWK